MSRRWMVSAYAALLVLAVSIGTTQAQTPVTTSGGTSGKLPKWTGTATQGSSSIIETGTGSTAKIGIGTTTPTQKLSVQGTIYSISGGFRFPDNSTQVKAFNSVMHDGTLTGAGTSLSLLKLAVPLYLEGSTAISSPVIEVVNNSPNTEAAHFLSWEGSSPAIFVQGYGTGVAAAQFYGDSSSGIYTYTGTATSTGITANNGYPGGVAGRFEGNVQITGTLSKSGGSFKIDHPLDPENKYLSHSFVESPDMMNIYNGNITTDGTGRAIVELPDWFEALNKDFRYQLTSIGGPAVVYVAEEIADNHFKIAGGKAGMKVSWQVTGIRQDAWANKHRIPVEEDKPEAERGYYLTPEAFDQPEEKSLEWARHPEQMKRMKDERERMKAEAPAHEGPTNQ